MIGGFDCGELSVVSILKVAGRQGDNTHSFDSRERSIGFRLGFRLRGGGVTVVIVCVHHGWLM